MNAIPAALREDDVVAALREILGSPANPRITLGIGDDAALWQPSRSHRSAITTDMLVEGVHFTRTAMTLADAGWRALAANASDLAAMGARPVLATVALGVSSETSFADLCELYRGLAAAAAQTQLAIVGGDLSRAPVLTIAIAAVGEVRAADAKTRAGARAGNVLAVTGELGAARAGLIVAQRHGVLAPELAEVALRAFRRPQARIGEGRFLAASRNVTAMMDCSDGLSTDLGRLCAASGLGAVVDAVPVAPAARALSRQVAEDAERFALSGGEDFELLVAVQARAFGYLAGRFEARFGRPLLEIGHLRAGSGMEFRGEPLERSGWEHFER